MEVVAQRNGLIELLQAKVSQLIFSMCLERLSVSTSRQMLFLFTLDVSLLISRWWLPLWLAAQLGGIAELKGLPPS